MRWDRPAGQSFNVELGCDRGRLCFAAALRLLADKEEVLFLNSVDMILADCSEVKC